MCQGLHDYEKFLEFYSIVTGKKTKTQIVRTRTDFVKEREREKSYASYKRQSQITSSKLTCYLSENQKGKEMGNKLKNSACFIWPVISVLGSFPFFFLSSSFSPPLPLFLPPSLFSPLSFPLSFFFLECTGLAGTNQKANQQNQANRSFPLTVGLICSAHGDHS